jgi:DNA replication protein DnaC
LGKIKLLTCDKLGYLSLIHSGAELLLQVFTGRYERGSLSITSNLAFGQWAEILRGERMTGALPDHPMRHREVLEMNGESHRFKQSVKRSRKIQKNLSPDK